MGFGVFGVYDYSGIIIFGEVWGVFSICFAVYWLSHLE